MAAFAKDSVSPELVVFAPPVMAPNSVRSGVPSDDQISMESVEAEGMEVKLIADASSRWEAATLVQVPEERPVDPCDPEIGVPLVLAFPMADMRRTIIGPVIVRGAAAPDALWR